MHLIQKWQAVYWFFGFTYLEKLRNWKYSFHSSRAKYE